MPSTTGWKRTSAIRSADHAALSVQVLEETAMLQDVEKAWRQRILTAIAQHNRLETDIGDPVASRLCDLVRDADRLDIYRVFAVDDIQDMTAHTAEEAAQSTASPAVIEALLAGRPVDKRDRQTPMDLWLTYLGFINDFRFPASYRLCKAAGFWRKRFDSIPLADPAVRACLEHVEVVLNEHCTGPERAASYRLCKAAGFWRKRFDSIPLADPAVRACLEHVEVVLNEHCTGPERDTAPD